MRQAIIPSHLTLRQVQQQAGYLDHLAIRLAPEIKNAVSDMQSYRHKLASEYESERNEVFELIGQ